MEKKLFVFDFDGTIVLGNTHNEIIKKVESDAPEYVNGNWAVVQDFPIIGSSDTWKSIFEDIIQQGHYVAINSFNSFGPIIPEFLEKIGLDKDFIKKEIHIIARFPANPAKENKNAYIQESIEKTIEKSGEKKDFSGNAEDVFLIDDSRKNIEAAKQAGYQVIHAKKDGSHLIELQNKLGELKKLEEKPPAVDRNAKPNQLSEFELLELKVKTLEKQREALVKQREEHLEEINIYSNSKAILLNDPKLNELDLADKENYDELSKVKSELSKLQGQVHNDKSAIVSREVIEQSPQRTVPETNSENQGAVPKKKPNAVKPEINLAARLKERSAPKDSQKPLSEVSKPTQAEKKLEELKKQKELEDLLKATPKKDELWKNSSSATKQPPLFLSELKKRQAMKGTSTFLGSGNASTSCDTKMPEKTAKKQFSR